MGDEQRSTPRSRFAVELRLARERRGLSLRTLAESVPRDHGHLGRIERGERQATKQVAEACDHALDAGGALLAAWRADDKAAYGRPAQLPAGPALMVGRRPQLEMLDSALLADRANGARVVLIDGLSGVGKTAVALHWATTTADRFPDGQLYADLGGFGPGKVARPVSSILAWFCSTLGATSVPADMHDRAALYRSLLAGRRVLVVADNAWDAEQVVPLVPGTRGSAMIVTSRRVLSGLIVQTGARRVQIRPLAEADAMALIARLISDDRAARERHAVRQLARLCGYLPLALRIAAERIASQPASTVADLVAELEDAGEAYLDGLTTGDGLQVRTAVSWSYRALTPAATAAFAALGIFPGQRANPGAVAALAGMTVPVVRRALRELAALHLIDLGHGDVVTRHDVVRACMIEQTQKMPATDRSAAVERLIAWYLHTVLAMRRICAPRVPLPLTPAPPPVGVEPLTFSSGEVALRWCDAELANLVALMRMALSQAPPGCAWQLALAWREYLVRRRPWETWITTYELALADTLRSGHTDGQAWILTNLAEIARQRGDLRASQDLYDQALELRRRAGDRLGQAWTLVRAAFLALDSDLHGIAHDFARRAYELFVRLGVPDGQAEALLAVATVYQRRDRHDRARAMLNAAMARLDDASSYSRAPLLVALSHLDATDGELDSATALLEQAAEEYRANGDDGAAVHTFICHGDLLHRRGRVVAARATWAQTLTYARQVHHSPGEADLVDRLDHGPPPTPATTAPIVLGPPPTAPHYDTSRRPCANGRANGDHG